MRALRLLLRQRLRLAWNRLARGPGRIRRTITTLGTLAFTLGFVTLAALNAGTLLDRMARLDPSLAPLALPAVLIAVGGLTLVTSLSSAFHHLFLAADLELLLAAPVPTRSLLWLAVLQTWRDSLHVLLFQAAALFGFGQALHLAPTYYALATLVGVGVTLSMTALGVCLTLLLARIRFGESVLGLTRLLSILLFVPVGLLGVPAFGLGRGRVVPSLFGPNAAQTMASSLQAIGEPPAWAPTTWAAHLMLLDDAAAISLVLLIAAGGVLVLVCELAFDVLYQAGWERVRFAGPRANGRAWRRWPRLLRLPALGAAGPVRSVLLKDWHVLLRDPRWRTSAVVSIVALGLPAMALFAGDPFAGAAHVQRFWFGLLPVPYLTYIIGSQQGAATLAYEGRNIALLRAAPIGMSRLVVAKALGGLALVLAVTWLLTLALALGRSGSPAEVAEALAGATWLGAGATIAAIAGAALTTDFETDNPQRRVGCLGAILTSLLSGLFFATNLLWFVWLMARSLAVFSIPRPLLGLAPVLDWGLAAAALASVITIAVAARVGMRRIAGWEAS